MTSPETITLDLDQPGHRGVVIGQHDGQIVFVRHGLPGEKGVEVALDASKKNGKQRFRTGQVLTIDQPSPHRVPGQCDAAAAGAGCCDLDFVDVEGSLDFKQAVVIDQFRRLGKFELPQTFLDAHVRATSLWPLPIIATAYVSASTRKAKLVCGNLKQRDRPISRGRLRSVAARADGRRCQSQPKPRQRGCGWRRSRR